MSIVETEKNLIDILYEKVKQGADSRLFLSLAQELRKNERNEEAMDVLIEGLKHNPRYYAARMTMAGWYLENNMPYEAQLEIEKALVYNVDDPSAHKLLARIYSERDNQEKALSHYREVLRLKPLDRESNSFVANLEQSRTSPVSIPETAQIEPPETVHAPILQDPEAVKRDLRQSELLIEKGRFKEALMLCSMILSVSPNDRKALQRKEELSTLLRLLNNKKESVINRLKRLEDTLTKVQFRMHNYG